MKRFIHILTAIGVLLAASQSPGFAQANQQFLGIPLNAQFQDLKQILPEKGFEVSYSRTHTAQAVGTILGHEQTFVTLSKQKSTQKISEIEATIPLPETWHEIDSTYAADKYFLKKEFGHPAHFVQGYERSIKNKKLNSDKKYLKKLASGEISYQTTWRLPEGNVYFSIEYDRKHARFYELVRYELREIPADIPSGN